MKKIQNNKKGILSKFFVKICRLFGYEIIDQSNFSVPTLGKDLNDNLSIPGKKSITVPLGEIKITRNTDSFIRSADVRNFLSHKQLNKLNKLH